MRYDVTFASGLEPGLKNLLKDSSPLRDRTKYAMTSNLRYNKKIRYNVTFASGLESGLKNLLKDSSPLRDRTNYAMTSNSRYNKKYVMTSHVRHSKRGTLPSMIALL